jgi:phytoene dehydrogenase-like protein
MTDASAFDVLIVGAGHNGLVSAAYLAKAGKKVLVLESNNTVGGAAATTEFAKGYSVSECAHFLYALHPSIEKDLRLQDAGLTYAATGIGTTALDRDGKHMHISGSLLAGENIPSQDLDSYREFHASMMKFAKVLAATMQGRPPKLMNNDLVDKLKLLKLGWQVRRLGRHDMRELLRLGTINIYDVLEENFESPLLKGALSLDAVLGSHTGPRSPNTVLGYLYRHVGEAFGINGLTIPKGGMGAVTEAIATSARNFGAEIRTGSQVNQILIEQNKIVGIQLTSNEIINATQVISNADPKATFSNLVGYPQLETEFSRRVHNIRSRGNAAKLHLALDSLPEFKGLSENDIGNRLVIAPDSDYVERAFNHAKYKEYSQAPVIEISIPTVHDPSLAPDGKHVLSAVVQYAPHNLDIGWSEANADFKALVIDLIDSYAPGLSQLVSASELLTPADIQSRFGTTGGHWHHAELALDQFLMLRPFPGMSQYSTPVEGLYLCSAGTHPGGNVMGLAGRNCAETVIKNGGHR